MTRPCASCGLYRCDGIECFLKCPADYPDEIEVPAPRATYVPSPEYLAWCARIDAERFVDCGPDPLKHLEPKSRRAA